MMVDIAWIFVAGLGGYVLGSWITTALAFWVFRD